MAKSLRSKWVRRMKAVKRERYGKKETDRLVKMLVKAGEFHPDTVQIKNEPMEAPPTPATPDVMMGAEGEPDQTEQATATTTSKAPEEKVLDRASRVRIARRSRSKKRAESRGAAVEESSSDEEEVQMETATPEKPQVERVYSRKTKTDQFGNYPVWYSVRKIQKAKKRNKKAHAKKSRYNRCRV